LDLIPLNRRFSIVFKLYDLVVRNQTRKSLVLSRLLRSFQLLGITKTILRSASFEQLLELSAREPCFKSFEKR